MYRAIIDMPELPVSCMYCEHSLSSYDDGLDTFICALLSERDTVLGLMTAADAELYSERRNDCPLREVPEWTLEDSMLIWEIMAVVESEYPVYDGEDTQPQMKALEKLCQLAGVEVSE